jgi:PAS domain S-box-containing protein
MKTNDHKNNGEILVVEDSRTQAEYLQHILEKEGYRVSLAYNGKQALDRMKINRPAVVLTDIIMPEMDGYELCSAIKKMEDLKEIPVVLVTQLFDPPDLIKGLEAGANDIIIKPFEPEHVIARLTSIIQSRAHPDSVNTPSALRLSFNGKTHILPENQLRTPAILLSSYDVAIRKNTELQEACDNLAAVNEDLRLKVDSLEQANEKLLSSLDPDKQQELKKILESEDRYRMITELSPFPISFMDSAGEYQYVNKKFIQLFGYTIGNIPPDKVWIAKTSPESAEGTNPVLVTGKDGTVRLVQCWPITLTSGEQFVIYEDLTHKTESERLRSILVSIVNSSNDAIIGKALDGTIMSWNKAAERYYGHLAEEVIGKSIDLIVPPELREQLSLFLKRVGNGETIERFDTVRLRKDGTRIGVCVTLSPIKNEDGHIIGISTIAQNIAEREKSAVNRMFREQVLHRR